MPECENKAALHVKKKGRGGGRLDEAIDAAGESRRSDLTASGKPDKGASPSGGLSLMAALGAPSIWQAEAPGWRAYASTTGMVLLALALALALQQFLASLNIALVFLTAVLGSAVAYGLWPSLFASLLSVVAYNYLLPAADLHHHDRRPGECHRHGVLRYRGGHRQQSRLARTQPGDRRQPAR